MDNNRVVEIECEDLRMQYKLMRLFLVSAGVLLSITAIAKLISASGGARILQTPDPILSVPFREVFWVVGGIELVWRWSAFSGRQAGLQAGLVAWLGTSFVAYRVGLLGSVIPNRAVAWALSRVSCTYLRKRLIPP